MIAQVSRVGFAPHLQPFKHGREFQKQPTPVRYTTVNVSGRSRYIGTAIDGIA